MLLVVAAGFFTATEAGAADGPKGTYMLLADGSVHKNEPLPTSGFFVIGKKQRSGFVPSGAVQGSGVLASDGQAGWLELTDGAFYADDSGRPPQAPYVRGRKGDDGVFRPDDQKVVY
jgi:hypothetical protein